MLRITVSKNAKAAAKYFDEGLSRQDYYAEKNEIAGKWHGKLAERLGLEGEVTKEQFEQLASNIDPRNGEKLNVRDSENRRAGYDFTFSAPKSVSMVYAMTKDKEILTAFNSAIQKSMLEVERDMQTQKGQGKNKEYVDTSNIAVASFTHFNARPVDGVPDPHLHQHCFVFNSTHNPRRERFQAIEVGTIKGNAPYYESLFHAELANELKGVGYGIERNERDFEIKGINRATIDKFSNRTKEVEREASKRELRSNKLKSELGAKTRAGKNKGLSNSEIEKRWDARLTVEEKESIFSAKNSGGDNGPDVDNSRGADKDIDAQKALDYAFAHQLERQSVVSEKRLLGDAFKRGIGAASPAEIKKEYAKREDVMGTIDRRTKDRSITTQAALDEEKKLIKNTRDGRGNYSPIHPDYQVKNEQLTKEQAGAVNHALQSRDFVTVIAGGAGVGKTWSIKEVAAGVKEAGKSFHAFAPSADASRGVQREEGFKDATTIAALLKDEKLQAGLKDGVVWLDESGMVGNQTMNQVMDIAKKQNAQLLLTGDIKQHNSVERGDALRIIQEYGGVKPAQITKIQRQKNNQYKDAVKQLSAGNVTKGYKTLEQMGSIKEVVDLPTLKKNVAQEYVTAAAAKKEALVVATTHAQGKEVTQAIRGQLREKGLLAKKEKTFTVHQDKSFTAAQKADHANYEAGLSIQFHQNVKGGFKRGGRYDVVGKDDQGNVKLRATAHADNAVEKKKEDLVLPMNAVDKFGVYEKQQIKLAEGDKIRITSNGFSDEKKRLNNGDIMTVKGFDKQGNILGYKGSRMRSLLTLDKNYRNLTHGYYTTSPASQGKSVDKVILMQSSASGKASSKEQFYVSASRGKSAISVYTDDKKFLLRSIQQSTTRTTASEIAQEQLSLKEKQQRRTSIYRAAVSKSKELWHKAHEKISNINQTIKQHVQTKTASRTR